MAPLIENEVLSLSDEERALLAAKLWESLGEDGPLTEEDD